MIQADSPKPPNGSADGPPPPSREKRAADGVLYYQPNGEGPVISIAVSWAPNGLVLAVDVADGPTPPPLTEPRTFAVKPAFSKRRKRTPL